MFDKTMGTSIRRITAALAAFTLVLALLPSYAYAASDDALNPQADVTLPASGTWGTCPWEIDTNGILTVYPGQGVDTGGAFPWESYGDVLREIVFAQDGSNKVIAPLDSSSLLCLGTSTSVSSTSIPVSSIDLSGLDTSQVTNMEGMFLNCTNLISLDVSGFDTSQVTNMRSMFRGCSSLTSLDLSAFDTSQVTGMSSMFLGCSSLTSLDLSAFDTSQVTGMSNMFNGCSSLTSLDLSAFDTSQVTSLFSGMFLGCSSLTSLDLSAFDTSQVKGMDFMFAGCSSLTSLDLSAFDTSQVTNMLGMFAGCSSLTSLDLSAFDTMQVKSMGNMFAGCSALNKISLGDKLSFKGSGDTVLTTLPEGKWFSSAQRRYLTPQEIAATQPGMLGMCSIPPAGTPAIIKGDKGVWTSNEAEGLSFESDAAFELFIGVKVDGVDLDESSYSASKGSTLIELKPGCLSSLAPGGHTISIVSAAGTSEAAAQARFTVLESISSAEVSLDHSSFIHDGTQKRPQVTVKCGNKILVADVDYTVTYPVSSSTVGTYMVTVTGKGNYTGTKQAAFEVVEASKPTPDEPKPGDPGTTDPKPDEPKPDDPGAIDPKPDDPGTQPDNPGTTDPDPGNPGTQPEDPGTTDPQPDDPGTVAPEPVATQVMYRAYNPNSGEHFYTASYGEVESIVAAGWQYEGEAWTAPVTSAVPVYRLYSGTDHHYTTSAYERDELVKVGWSYEGIGWYSDEAMGVGLHRLFNPNVDPNAPRNNSGSHHYTTSDEERDHLVSIGWRYEDYGWYGVR